jgi:hypothetical protein
MTRNPPSSRLVWRVCCGGRLDGAELAISPGTGARLLALTWAVACWQFVRCGRWDPFHVGVAGAGSGVDL